MSIADNASHLRSLVNRLRGNNAAFYEVVADLSGPFPINDKLTANAPQPSSPGFDADLRDLTHELSLVLDENSVILSQLRSTVHGNTEGSGAADIVSHISKMASARY